MGKGQIIGGRYKLEEKLGRGSFGSIYKAQDLENDTKVAVKKINADCEEVGLPQDGLREICVLRDCEPHPNILRLLDVVLTPSEGLGRLWLVVELMARDLSALLTAREEPLPKAQVSSYAYQMLRGLAFLHDRFIIHRDLVPRNILLDLHGGLKLADFGLSCFVEPSRRRALTSDMVTRWYRAPEVLLTRGKYSFPIDIWAAGLVLLEMFQLRPLLPGDSEIDQLFRIFRAFGTPSEAEWPGVTGTEYWPAAPPQFQGTPLKELVRAAPRRARALAARMLVYDPERRVTAKEALKDRYFAHVRLELGSGEADLGVLAPEAHNELTDRS